MNEFSKLKKNVIEKKSRNIKSYTNIACALIYTIWIAWPFSHNFLGGYYTGILISLIWIFTIDYRCFRRTSWDVVLVVIFLITLFPYILVGKGVTFSEAGVYFLNIIGILFIQYYLHYKKDYEALRKIGFLSLIFYSIGSFQTYSGLQQYPMASRMLAGAVANNPNLQATYEHLGIGGFGYIYSATFLLIALFFQIIYSGKSLKVQTKVLSVISIVLLMMMILEASYVIAFILIFFGILMVLIVKNMKVLLILVLFSILLFFVIPQNQIAMMFLNIASFFSENKIVYERFLDLAEVFMPGENAQLTNNRVGLYTMSLNSFLYQPIFGIYGPFGSPASFKVGGHSGWLDLLGSYGMFSAFPLFLAIKVNFRRSLNYFKSTAYYRMLLAIQLLYIFFGLLNPVLINHEIGYAVFAIIPTIPFICKRNIYKDLEEMKGE